MVMLNLGLEVTGNENGIIDNHHYIPYVVQEATRFVIYVMTSIEVS